LTGLLLKINQSSPITIKINREIELDESYFGSRRIRRATEKTIVFIVLKRDDKVYLKIVPKKHF
jgi:hypothetical protein